VSVTLIGFSSLLIGGFSRFGLWRQIAVAVVLLVIVQGLATSATDLGARIPHGYLLAYVAPILGLLMSSGLLWWVGRPRNLSRGRSSRVTA
jgi:lipopolysaccharide export system permease protein